MEFVEVTFAGGQVLVPARIDDPEQKVGFGERLRVSFDEVLGVVSPLANTVRDAARTAGPDEFTLTLKVGVAIKAGKALAYIADGQVDGALELTFTWKQH
ncbi:hypothetical protein SRABI76_00801 [Microbacterium oxydans]|nr:hypothetical protein SRABI76_00801 [Microbacterium oxydans]